jgi:hypothetical protein
MRVGSSQSPYRARRVRLNGPNGLGSETQVSGDYAARAAIHSAKLLRPRNAPSAAVPGEAQDRQSGRLVCQR